ncbi:MAG TPA: type 1 glutamine amidotransferase [Solirubrobacterales bacterium]|nr:type 1 glutamine amidotransferase [Solirubrobacterales bacterium]
MRALAIVHQRDAGPGVFADEIRARGVELDEWLLSERGTAPAVEIAGYDAILTFGGAMHADQEDRHPWLRFEKDFLAAMIDDRMPLLAVCLGSQLLAEAAGGSARRASEPEIGWHRVEVTEEGRADPLLGPMAPGFEAFQWHSYEALPPESATLLARSPVCAQAYRVGEVAWAIQFHAEVSAADAEAWIDDYRSDEDAVRIGVDPEALRTETREKIGDWSHLGRELCGRFLEAVG